MSKRLKKLFSAVYGFGKKISVQNGYGKVRKQPKVDSPDCALVRERYGFIGFYQHPLIRACSRVSLLLT